MSQLVQLQKDLDKIKNAGVTLVAVSYDPAEALAKFAEQKHITYPLLSDADSKIIEAYGLRDPKGQGYAIPGTVILDKDGVVRQKLFEIGYVKRHSTDALIEAVKAIK